LLREVVGSQIEFEGVSNCSVASCASLKDVPLGDFGISHCEEAAYIAGCQYLVADESSVPSGSHCFFYLSPANLAFKIFCMLVGKKTLR
jgi:hypothetical protein